MKIELREYQKNAMKWMLKNPRSALFADPGLGKTAIVLAILTVLKKRDFLNKALIIAPLRVATITWPDEIESWDQFSELSYHVLHGSKKNPKDSADIHLINPEGLAWLWDHLKKEWPYDVLIVDESTKFKNFNKRTKQLLSRVKKFKRRHILTGTPAPRSLLNLYSQIKILDGGFSLGETMRSYQSRYFIPCGYQNREWKIRPGADKEIEEKISSIVLRLDAKDYLDIPEILENKIDIRLDDSSYLIYRQMEKKLFAELEETTVIAVSAASSYGKCRQIANGFVYETNLQGVNIPHKIHFCKLDAVENFIEEMNGKPVLLAYWYRYDLEMLREYWPDVPVINGDTSPKVSQRYIEQWNNSEIPLLFAQPLSCSHGLNMQKGSCRDILWYSLPDDLEVYSQFNDRIHRSGVGSQVRVHHLIARGTIDEAILMRLKLKDRQQMTLLDALKQYQKEKGNLQ